MFNMHHCHAQPGTATTVAYAPRPGYPIAALPPHLSPLAGNIHHFRPNQ